MHTEPMSEYGQASAFDRILKNQIVIMNVLHELHGSTPIAANIPDAVAETKDEIRGFVNILER